MSLNLQCADPSRIPYDCIVFSDTETTGLYPYGRDQDGNLTDDIHGPDRLCSLAAVKVHRDGNSWVIGERRSWVCDPRRPIPERAAAINGFHWSQDGECPEGRTQLCGMPSADEVLREFGLFVDGLPLGFHNNAFDAAVLDAELERAGLPLLAVPLLCTKKAFSDIQGLGRPNRYVAGTNLNRLCDELGVDRTLRVGVDGQSEQHGALPDALMAAQCFAILEPLGWMQLEDPAGFPHRAFCAKADVSLFGR